MRPRSDVATPVALLGKFPLTSYFIIALVFSWAVVLIVLLGYLPENFMAVVPITLGPTVAALVMTVVTEGRAGIRRLLARFVLWKVPFVWYLFIFLGIPLVFILGTVFLPGSAASFDHLSAATWLSYVWKFPLVLAVGGPLLEEPGWRGFALARLQAKWGPLVGTLILGFLWAAWHYPQYLMPGWAAQNGGFHVRAVAVFTLSVTLLTIVMKLGVQQHARQPAHRDTPARLHQHLLDLYRADVSGAGDKPGEPLRRLRCPCPADRSPNARPPRL